jgi:RNA polymerase sigma factor (sigma-70 family)
MASTALRALLHNLRRSSLRRDTASRTDGELVERFVARRDEAAFEALLRRHGPMVLAVCRRVLGNEADAEDAFQSTFLVLARKAAAVRPQRLVGNWLYGVAHTTSLKARAMRTKRSAKEREAAARAKPEIPAEAWRHPEALLDRELQALPGIYRAAIVLCELEGKSLKEAARQLGCPVGTIGARLARGRALLARRLVRQGLSLSPAALAAALAHPAARAAVPPALASATCKAAALFAAGTAAAGGLVSTEVALLTDAALKALLLTKLKVASAVLLVVPLFAAAAGICYSTPSANPGGPAAVFATAMLDSRSLPASREAATIAAIEQEPVDDDQRGAERNARRIDSGGMVEDAPKHRGADRAVKLPPGLAKKPANHPGRVAWLKAHQRPDGTSFTGD